MKITINGNVEDLGEQKITVSKLLELKQVKMPDMVSVELNGEFLDRDKFDSVYVKEDDQIEFLYFMGGGSSSVHSKWGFETKLVHCGITPSLHGGATSVPIYETVSFAYDTAQGLADVFDGKEFGYIYSRISNPTVTAFEQRINELENGIGAVATSSGMAAISTVVFALTEQGDEIISSKSLFGGTFLLFNKIFEKYGVKIKYVDATDIEAYKSAVSEKTRLIFVETIGNPKLDVPDIKSIAQVANDNNIPFVVDSTLSTPYLFNAKEFGADIVVHSTTKYITGNGSAVGGVLVDCGNYDWKDSPVREIRGTAKKINPELAFLSVARKNIIQNVGMCPAPSNAFLHNMGLETLALRMEKHCINALELAAYLAGHSKIVAVNYPGLEDNAFHTRAGAQFKGKYGGLLTFRLASREQCFKCIDGLNIVLNLANLGDSRTLIIHPASTIYHDCTTEEMQAAGVTEDLLRISVGIEYIDDIKSDLDHALKEID